MIIVMMGVSGVGKTTIGTLLAQKLNMPFYDGDDFHSKENIEKMQQGIALTDADRQPWLQKMRELAQHLQNTNQSAVIACSALRRAYRKALEVGKDMEFVFLKGDYDLIERRLQQRQNHFMSPALLRSQFEALEASDDMLTIDVSDTPAAIVQTICDRLERI